MSLMWRRWALAGLILFIGGVALSWYAGGRLIAPATRPLGPPPQALAAVDVEIPSTSGSRIRGWLSRGATGQGAVLLLHGVRGNRTDMASRAQFLRALGYSVLLIDLQAHGESPGSRITFGELESRDVSAATAFLRRSLPGEHIGIIGVSLGAAATVLAKKPLGVDAIVLESMYPTIEQAVEDRLRYRMGAVGALLAPLVIAQIGPRIDVDPQRLRPVDEIGKIGAPLLLIHGSEDRHTTLEEAQSVFAAAAQPKTFWQVEGAAHVNLHKFARQEYEQRVSAFLSSRLLRPVAPAPAAPPPADALSAP
jgi:fermentation-respiration switch protein FrsA (DUF1100 family)